MTAAATTFDMDNDGDLDMVTHTVNGPIAVFRNNAQSGHSIRFEIRDTMGNHFGIGAVIEIRTDDGQSQSCELQLGGGFMSFDAPVIHFGLGENDAVSDVIIHWANGGTSNLGPLKAGSTYRILKH